MPRLSPLFAYTEEFRADLRAELQAERGHSDGQCGIWAKQCRIRKVKRQGATRFEVMGEIDNRAFCRTLEAATPSQAVREAVKVVLAFFRGETRNEFLPTPTSLKKIERDVLTDITSRGLRREGERRKIRHLKKTLELITTEHVGRVDAHTLLALINAEPQGTRRQDDMVETCRKIAKSIGVELVLPTKTREELARSRMVPVRETLSNDEVRQFVLEDLAPLLESPVETVYRAAWLYTLTALTGSRMGALCTIDEPILDLTAGKEYALWDTKRDKPGRAIISLMGCEHLDLSRRPDNLPTMSSSERPTDSEMAQLVTITNNAMKNVRKVMGKERHALFTPRQLRHSCAARLIQLDVPTVMVAGTLNTSEAMIERTYGGMARSFAAKTIRDRMSQIAHQSIP